MESSYNMGNNVLTRYHGPKGKSLSMILLKEHGDKMTTNGTIVYAEITASSNRHQRSFILQLMTITTSFLRNV